METPKLEITPKRYTGESTVISMRLPKDMLKEIDSVAERSGRTRNELLQMGMEFALRHMEIKDE
jgi:metal-responsive CopG/Arc/MetJ family transcriptional regulator